MFPEWMKPNLSKIIGIRKTAENGEPVVEIRECGRKIDSTVLNYLFMYAIQKQINISVEVDGYVYNYYFSEVV